MEESTGVPRQTPLPTAPLDRPEQAARAAATRAAVRPSATAGSSSGSGSCASGRCSSSSPWSSILSLLSPFFFSTRNLGNVLAATAAIAVLSMGQLLVILTRGIDLSVGSTLALASVVGALVFTNIDSGLVVITAMLATGLLVGAVNGVVYVKGRLPHPFIITLAMLSIARGLALWLSGGQPIRGMPEIVDVIGGGSIGWLPVSAILVLGIAFLVFILTTRIVWGRWIYSVGGNPEAARRTGIPVNKVLISVYVLSGLMAGHRRASSPPGG